MKPAWAAIALTLSLSACGGKPDWTGFVYPNAEDLTVSAEIGRFQTFEQCAAGSIRTLGAFGRLGIGTYECGRACSYSPDTGLAICAETRDG